MTKNNTAHPLQKKNFYKIKNHVIGQMSSYFPIFPIFEE